jgi:spermidine/putrescine transport system permease protein
MSTPSTSRSLLPSGLKLLQWGLGTWTALVFAFLYLPIGVLIFYSFNTSRLNIRWEGFTFHWYERLASNEPILRALQNSLIIATVTTLASVVLGTAGAWILYRYRFRFTGAIQTLVCLPMVMPEIVMGISLLVLFTVLTLPLGFTTVIIAHITFCFPFVLVAVQARLQGIDPALEEAALDLGATPFQAFWLVIVPALKPAILSGALMAFTLSLDELIVTFFTANAATRTLPLQVFGLAKTGLNPMLNALSAVFIVSTIDFVRFSEHLRRLARPSGAPHS